MYATTGQDRCSSFSGEIMLTDADHLHLAYTCIMRSDGLNHGDENTILVIHIISSTSEVERRPT